MSRRESIIVAVLLLVTLTAHALIWFHGAAANPYAVVLLVPIAAAMLLLPFRLAWLVVIVTMGGQLMQLIAPVLEHQPMTSHYHAMVYGQLFAAGLLGLTLHYLRLRLQRQELALHALHQRQARDEQLVAIGTAAAQFSHELGNPIQAIQLLLEQTQLEQPDNDDLQQLAKQTLRLQQLLNDWREVAEDVRSQRQRYFTPQQMLQQLRDAWQLIRPDITVRWHCKTGTGELLADRTLLPALLSLLQNAAQASDDASIDVHCETAGGQWHISMVNRTAAAQFVEQLGSRLVPSAQTGAGALLSSATIERFKGSVHWQATENQVITRISLPLQEHRGLMTDGVTPKWSGYY